MIDEKRINVTGSRTYEITITAKELRFLDFEEWPDEKDLIEAIHEAIYLAYARL